MGVRPPGRLWDPSSPHGHTSVFPKRSPAAHRSAPATAPAIEAHDYIFCKFVIFTTSGKTRASCMS